MTLPMTPSRIHRLSLTHFRNYRAATLEARGETFDLVFIMTRGGPSNATEVFTMLIYEQGIRNGRIGEASSAAMMAMPIFAALIIILTRYLQDKDEERV